MAFNPRESQIDGSKGKVPNAYGNSKDASTTDDDDIRMEDLNNLGNGINSASAMRQVAQNKVIYERDRGPKISFLNNFDRQPGILPIV